MIRASLKHSEFRVNPGPLLDLLEAGLWRHSSLQAQGKQGAVYLLTLSLVPVLGPGWEGSHLASPITPRHCLPVASRPDCKLHPPQQGPGTTISSGFRSMFKTSCGSGWLVRCFACSMRSKATSMSAGTCAWPGMWPTP